MKKSVTTSPEIPSPIMNDATKKHLKDAHLHMRNAYSFLLAHNPEHARQQLSAGLSHLDRVVGPL